MKKIQTLIQLAAMLIWLLLLTGTTAGAQTIPKETGRMDFSADKNIAWCQPGTPDISLAADSNDVSISRVDDPVGTFYPTYPGYYSICLYHPFYSPFCSFIYTVVIKNHGLNPQTSIPVTYSYEVGGTVYTDIWTGNLQAGDSVNFSLSIPFQPIFGPQEVFVCTSLPGDPVPDNDTCWKNWFGTLLIKSDEGFPAEGTTLTQNSPNPATGLTTLQATFISPCKVHFGLSDCFGRLMISEVKEVLPGSMEYTYDVSHLPSGVYFYFVEDMNPGGNRVTRKMLVQ